MPTALGGDHIRALPPEYPRTPRVEEALDLLFPPICVGCRRVGRWVCGRCWRDISWLVGETCGTCGELSATNPCASCASATSRLRRVIAVAEFEAVPREAVHALKYENRHAISGLMGRLMGRAAAHVGADLVAHVALHPSRRRERGYDQSALLARHIAHELGIPYQKDTLARTRKTRQQVTLGPRERRQNVEGAFRARRPVPGHHVLLVDDVYTTGSTLEAAAGALKEAGAACVTGLVFARAHAGADGIRR